MSYWYLYSTKLYVKLKSIAHKLFYRMFSSLFEAKNESYKAPVC